MCVMLFLYVKMDDENKFQAPLKLTSAKHNIIDLELTIDPGL